MTAYGTSLSDTLNTTAQEHITVYLDGLKEVFVFSESLTYGQHTLIGNFKIHYFLISFNSKLFFKVPGLEIILVQ